MIIKHGIDITSINRSEFRNEKLSEKLLHKNELDLFLLIKDEHLRIRFLAAR
jgi:phosphopantetheinyl transferase (holo-ACP synthase)